MTIETWNAIDPDLTYVRVTLDDGERHQCTISYRDWCEDAHPIHAAASFMRHAEMLDRSLPPSADKGRAILTDHHLAVEALFPHLRGRLPA